MKEWYMTLDILDKVFFYIAIVASVILIIQIVMMLFSFAGGEVDAGSGADMDIDGDIDGDADLSDGGLSFFTVKTVTAFFTIGGWAGFAASTGMESVWLPILISVLAGTAAFFIMGFTMKGLYKMQCSGNLVRNNLVGKTATVYVSIPENRKGKGKITLVAQESFSEFDAVTENERLETGTSVTIVSYEEDCMVVEKIKK